MRRPVRGRRGARPQRKRLFVGCEGESERGYAALLQRYAEIDDLLVHIDPVLLQPGGGDPCALVERALALLTQRERRHGDPYANSFVLLDTDKLGQTPQRDQRARQIAERAGLTLVWQEPCHEAMLLRHLENCTNLQPGTTPLALQQLTQRWPALPRSGDVGYAELTDTSRTWSSSSASATPWASRRPPPSPATNRGWPRPRPPRPRPRLTALPRAFTGR